MFASAFFTIGMLGKIRASDDPQYPCRGGEKPEIVTGNGGLEASELDSIFGETRL